MLPTPSQSSQSPEEVPATTTPTATKITRGHSCILCQQRKVKCDRQKPCSNCVKARVECIPSVPTAPRRRRRKFSEQDLATRLKRCEQLLKKHGVKLEDDAEEPLDCNSAPGDFTLDNKNNPRNLFEIPSHDGGEGVLFTDKNNSHYVENTLWENLRDEIVDPQDALQTISDEDEINESGMHPEPERFFLGPESPPKELRDLHPEMVHIFRLWQIFLSNVNPLVKIFHAPTVQQIILDASADLDNVPKHVEALMFSMYLLAVTSMLTEDCEKLLGETRDKLLSRFSYAAQQSLINARFMKSLNLMTLQALILYILAVRKYYDPHSFWILTGTAVRVAQRLGIHKDGPQHKISPFEDEFRRRTWWQLVFLEGQASKLAGAGFPAWLIKFGTKLPTNISDSELSPTMTEAPVDKEGVTDMIAVYLRYEVAMSIRAFISRGFDGDWSVGRGPELIAEKDKAIDELETKFQEKYIRHCDPTIPIHLLAIYMSRSVICSMRLMAHHPRQYPDKGATMPQKEKDMLFNECLKELEISSIAYENKLVQGFLWHMHVHFQLNAFIYLISELRHRTIGEQVDRAWKEVERAYEHRTEMLNEPKNSLYFAVGNLTLKSWAKREEAGGLYQGAQVQAAPRFISVLRMQRRIPESSTPNTTDYRQDISTTKYLPTVHVSREEYAQTHAQALTSYPNTIIDSLHHDLGRWNNTDVTMDENMPDISIDWEYYQTLLDGELPAYYGNNDALFKDMAAEKQYSSF